MTHTIVLLTADAICLYIPFLFTMATYAEWEDAFAAWQESHDIPMTFTPQLVAAAMWPSRGENSSDSSRWICAANVCLSHGHYKTAAEHFNTALGIDGKVLWCQGYETLLACC
jgi:cytochrome c-type biogenesis protein CcmH/NrfG